MAFAQDAVFNGTTLIGDQPPGNLDMYGDHVAANKKWLMIGAPREDIDLDNDGLSTAQGDIDVGAVYVYRRTPAGPVLHQKIEGQGNNVIAATPGDRFGAGIVLQGDIMFVGAANDDNFPGFADPAPDPDQDFLFAGQVYVFNYDRKTGQWLLTEKLTSDEPNTLGQFGARTDSSHMELFSFGKGKDGPKVALIGEVENLTGVPPTLHVFNRENKKSLWERVQKIGAPSGVTDAFFADAVEGVANFALVPESFIDPVLDPTVVHVYRINKDGIDKVGGALMPVQTLAAPGGLTDRSACPFIGFGAGMDAADDIVAIGDPCDSTGLLLAGAVHVYSVDTSGDDDNNNPLSLVDTLTSPNAAPGAFFASNFGTGKQTVTTDGDLIAVGTANLFGASGQDDVHLYARDPGASTFTLVDSESSPAPGIPTIEIYGQSVTLLGGNELAIGQMTDGTAGTLNGRVFLFDIQ